MHTQSTTSNDWPTTLELTLDGIAQGGEAVGRWQGRVVFVAGGLPGERVRATIHEARPAYAHAVVSELLSTTTDRVVPRQPGADQMPWQHIAYPAQLRFKRQILADQLAKIAGLHDLPVAATLPAASTWGYRNAAHLHINGDQLGYHIGGTQALQPISSDPLLLPQLNQALAGLRALLAPDDSLSDVVVRASESYGYSLALLRGTGDIAGRAAEWRELCPGLAGVVLAETGAAPHSLGSDHLYEVFAGLVFRLRPATFFQVNLAAASQLLELARAGLALSGGERVLDLYCGAGAFTLPLAGTAAELVGIEEHPGAIADARASAALNAIQNVEFVVGQVESALDQLTGHFDAAVLDPPRRGCHPRALAALLRLAPQRLVYISCHPGTLARDLRILTGGGYRLLSAQPVDLFPQTPHIESVVVLAR